MISKPKTLKLLEKLNIRTDTELLEYYPFRYDIIQRSDINSLSQDDNITIDGIVEGVPLVYYISRNLNKMTFKINASDNLYNVIIYNRAFYKSNIKSGITVTVIGKFDKIHNTIVASNMELKPLNEIPRISPIYHTTLGITSKQINYYVKKVKLKLEELLPKYLVEKYKLYSKNKSVFIVHNPTDVNTLKKARLTLKYEELFLFMLKVNYLRLNKNIIGLKRRECKTEVEDLISHLPFELTKDQKTAIDEIYEDLISNKRMNRLLQGDVGSGKTIVSFIATYINFLSGYQTALMAPTEILALQHYNNAKRLFGKDVKIGLLTGKLKLKEKQEIYKKLNQGEIDVIIGTHALFTNNVEYKNLGLVITDEQHRFGVLQRLNLKNKGMIPDILYMSATPIPRTYALTLYGDMDVSNIKTMPKGRKEIITLIKKENEMKDVLKLIHQELLLKHQIYVIAPLIEESEKVDLQNVYDLAEKFNQAFGKICSIGIMHGKMSNAEKDKTMDKFKKNEISILISTTVIEVGVDVPNATTMVIFDSFKFGLSTLHQLRGRVGRSDLQSYCVLITNKDRKRLDILVETNDGFKISEEDFLLRGSGDMFGFKQSGDMNFKIANIKMDYELLLKAKEDSLKYLESKEYLNNESIKKMLIVDTDLN